MMMARCVFQFVVLMLCISCENKATFNEQNLQRTAELETLSQDIPIQRITVKKTASLGEKISINFVESVEGNLVSLDLSEISAQNPFIESTSQFELVWSPNFAAPIELFSAQVYGQTEVGPVVIDLQLELLPFNIEQGDCRFSPEPVIGDIDPAEKWHWAGFLDDADVSYHLTYSSPVAGDLDNDGFVEVVTTISTTQYNDSRVPIIVLNGKTGEVIWNSIGSPVHAESSTTPALVDLDNDGTSEIIVVGMKKELSELDGTPEDVVERKIMAIDYKSRSIKWEYTGELNCTKRCMLAVADMDGDGLAEISAGDVILSFDGKLKSRLVPTPTFDFSYIDSRDRPRLRNYGITTIADLVPERAGLEVIVAGSQVYDAEGSLIFDAGLLGYSAVADIDGDGKPDLVVVGQDKVSRVSASGAMQWQRDIPKDAGDKLYGGGAPNLGDFTGDGKMEIGTATGAFYLVYTADGDEVWRSASVDKSSMITGSTLFDFNADGRVEVVYNDEYFLRIYDGRTGAILWETENRSGTLVEYPVVVDLDQDGSADILVSSPGSGGNNVPGGLRAFGDPEKKWQRTRKVWNQYSYYPELVSSRLKAKQNVSVPKLGFRVNRPLGFKNEKDLLLPDAFVKTEASQINLIDGNEIGFLLGNKGQADLVVTGYRLIAVSSGLTEVVNLEKQIIVKPGQYHIENLKIVDTDRFKSESEIRVIPIIEDEAGSKDVIECKKSDEDSTLSF